MIIPHQSQYCTGYVAGFLGPSIESACFHCLQGSGNPVEKDPLLKLHQLISHEEYWALSDNFSLQYPWKYKTHEESSIDYSWSLLLEFIFIVYKISF